MLDKFVYLFIAKKSRKSISDSSIHLLNETEIRYIKKIEFRVIFLSAFTGAFMVLALYLPQYYFPSFFSNQSYPIPIINVNFDFSIICFIYGLFLLYIEILILSFLDIYCAHIIAYATGFISDENENEGERKSLLINIANQKKNKEILTLGINPFLGFSKSKIFFLNLLQKLKATLSNVIVKLVARRLLGRYAVRQVIDMLGIPVFAFWNAWGTRKVLRETRIIIMCQNYLPHFNEQVLNFREINENEIKLLFDTLQFIATSKRDFHQNHFLLSKLIISKFNIPLDPLNPTSQDTYLENLANSAEDFKGLNEKIILLGFILDGKLSLNEKKRIKMLNEANAVIATYNNVLLLQKNFFEGKGLF